MGFAAMAALFWLHLLATGVWMMALFQLFRNHEPPLPARDLQRYARYAWFSLVILGATGMFQMGENPNYGGILAIDNTWSAAILIKHLVIFGCAGLMIWISLGLIPALARTALLGQNAEKAAGVTKRLRRAALANLILTVFILFLTAAARVS